jgi:hypothetical protein
MLGDECNSALDGPAERFSLQNLQLLYVLLLSTSRQEAIESDIERQPKDAWQSSDKQARCDPKRAAWRSELDNPDLMLVSVAVFDEQQATSHAVRMQHGPEVQCRGKSGLQQGWHLAQPPFSSIDPRLVHRRKGHYIRVHQRSLAANLATSFDSTYQPQSLDLPGLLRKQGFPGTLYCSYAKDQGT